jgi:hypothetical protein
MATPPPVDNPDTSTDVNAGSTAPKIGGLSTLKGLILYAAVLTFAGLYIYFIVEILAAPADVPPDLDAAPVKAAALLAGVLGSAFALEIGTPTEHRATNHALRAAMQMDQKTSGKHRLRTKLRRVLSLEPSNTDSASWPKTFGIWAYAIIAGCVTLTYILNSGQTPDAIKALAIAFGGYIVALINTAYGLATK